MIHHDDDLRQFEANGAAPLPPAIVESYVEYEGARIWYATYGAGSPVVLLHGAFDNSEDWGYQVPALVAGGHRAILIDNRGRGRSTLGNATLGYELLAREVLAVMDALAIPKFAVVGWSDGATIGLILAMKHASRITRVFAFAGGMDLTSTKDVPPNEPKLARVFGRAKKDYARLSPAPEGFAEMAKAMHHMMSTEPTYTAAEVATIEAPVAIVAGANDEFLKPEYSPSLARTIQNAKFILLPDVSHFAMLQRPALFNEAMLEFLDTV